MGTMMLEAMHSDHIVLKDIICVLVNNRVDGVMPVFPNKTLAFLKWTNCISNEIEVCDALRCPCLHAYCNKGINVCS